MDQSNKRLIHFKSHDHRAQSFASFARFGCNNHTLVVIHLYVESKKQIYTPPGPKLIYREQVGGCQGWGGMGEMGEGGQKLQTSSYIVNVTGM